MAPQKHVKCPACSRKYQSGQVAILGMHGDDYLIRCICTCGVIATFMFSEESSKKDPPVSFDDVLFAHFFLEQYVGGIDGLFSKAPEALPPGEPA